MDFQLSEEQKTELAILLEQLSILDLIRVFNGGNCYQRIGIPLISRYTIHLSVDIEDNITFIYDSTKKDKLLLPYCYSGKLVNSLKRFAVHMGKAPLGIIALFIAAHDGIDYKRMIELHLCDKNFSFSNKILYEKILSFIREQAENDTGSSRVQAP